jgi:pilus assembly protein CpaC
MPGIASIPILGELFRSKSINNARTELIVVATPEIIDPTSATAPPSEPEFPVQDLLPNTFDSTLKQKSKQ